MQWNELYTIQQIEEIRLKSDEKPQLIFKHSTRCEISRMALSRLQRHWNTNAIEPYLLDLLQHREISNEISNTFDVAHQSPQVLVIKKGACVFDESHNAISFDDIMESVK